MQGQLEVTKIIKCIYTVSNFSTKFVLLSCSEFNHATSAFVSETNFANAIAAWISYSYKVASVDSNSYYKSSKIDKTYSPVVPSLLISARD